MDKQDIEAMIRVLTSVVDREMVSSCGLCRNICDCTQKDDNAQFFLDKYIPLWKDEAASGRILYPITITKTPVIEYEIAKANNTMYADTPYGDARRRLATFLRSKAEEELALLVGDKV